jgi:hypothetical protein
MACRLLLPDEALDKVQTILEEARNDKTVQVNNDFLSIALYSIATVESPSMPEFAESIVNVAAKQRLKINRSVYNALIYCWAKSSNRDAGMRALEILEKMTNDPELKPDAKSYHKCSRCFEGKQVSGLFICS